MHKKPFLKIAGIMAGVLFYSSALAQTTVSQLPEDTAVGLSVYVDPAQVITAVPSRFAGISFEMSNICMLLSWDAASTKLGQLLQNISPAVARFGGNTADKAVWNTTGAPYSCSADKTVLTPSLVNALFTLGQKTGWKIIWTLNMAHYAPTTYSTEADYVIDTGGSNLYALGMGNEPDLYHANGIRPSTYTYTDYQQQWDSYRKSILELHPDAHLMGNDDCCDNAWLTNFITNTAPTVSLITKHYYALGQPATATALLSQALMQSTATTIDAWVSAASSANVPLALDETNSVSEGGQAGLSNSFAATLWGGDYLFTALEHKVSHINFHTGVSPSVYSPIANVAETPEPAALYYSLLLFHYAAPGGNAVSTTLNTAYNVSAHSIASSDGKLYVTLFNKEQAQPISVQINTPAAYKSASVMRLTAGSVAATQGITFGGSAVASDGTWTPGASEPVSISGNVATVAVPAASAAVVTLIPN